MYSVLLLDLDGTLNDSCPGITKSVAYALRCFGIEADPGELLGFIGPPLTWSFPHFYPAMAGKEAEGIVKFREYYESQGMFDGSVYEGIPEALEILKQAGFRLAVATSKPAPQATPILEHMGLAPYFDAIEGACLDETETKADVIRRVLHKLGDPDKKEVLMIGDREHDIEGGKACGLATAGVLWGYGSEEELTSHGATHLFSTPAHMTQFLLEM